MSEPPLKKIKTGAFSRRFELAKTGALFGARSLFDSALNAAGLDQDASGSRRRNMEFLVHELGKLKGSVVKVGQLMATYGEYLLPPEVSEVLHELEDDTPPLVWGAIEKQLRRELGEERLAELEISQQPVAAASLGQVHRARCKVTGADIALKIQYPGVAETIDADFDAVIRLLRLARLLESSRAVDEWLRDVRELLYREIDYVHEHDQMVFAARQLRGDDAFFVPAVHERYCTPRVLAMDWAEGVSVNDVDMGSLSQARRDKLSRDLLRLFLIEFYDWRRMQTDPNFGNYLIQLDPVGDNDRLVLLDFGAMRDIPESFSRQFGAMVSAAWHNDREWFIRASIELQFMREHYPQKVLDDFADVGMDIIEPLKPDLSGVVAEALNANGDYHWRNSELPKRIAKRAVKASLSKHFAVPPKEFMFVIRKLMGVYAMISALDGQFNGAPLLRPYITDISDSS